MESNKAILSIKETIPWKSKTNLQSSKPRLRNSKRNRKSCALKQLTVGLHTTLKPSATLPHPSHGGKSSTPRLGCVMPKRVRSNTSLGSKTIAVTSLARGWHPLRSCSTQLGISQWETEQQSRSKTIAETRPPTSTCTGTGRRNRWST